MGRGWWGIIRDLGGRGQEIIRDLGGRGQEINRDLGRREASK